MTRGTIWQHMAHLTRHPLLNLGMGTLLPLSSRAGDWASGLGAGPRQPLGPMG